MRCSTDSLKYNVAFVPYGLYYRRFLSTVGDAQNNVTMRIQYSQPYSKEQLHLKYVSC